MESRHLTACASQSKIKYLKSLPNWNTPRALKGILFLYQNPDLHPNILTPEVRDGGGLFVVGVLRKVTLSFTAGPEGYQVRLAIAR